MLRLLSLLLGAMVSLFALDSNARSALDSNARSGEMKSVESVDLSRYAGTWYQIARKPVIFEAGCVCSRQVLTPAADGRIEVYNTCNFRKLDGSVRDISGFASVVEGTGNAQLKVDFGLPWKGDYWIIALDPEYRYAVVSDPARRSLYVLSKTPELSDDLYEQAVASVADQVEVAKLKKTPQAGCTYP